MGRPRAQVACRENSFQIKNPGKKKRYEENGRQAKEIKTISGRQGKNIGGKENLRNHPREKIQQKKHEDARNIRRFNLSVILILA